MSIERQAAWRGMAEALDARFAASVWRLPVVAGAVALGVFLPLYLVRGVRLVRLGAVCIAAILGASIAFAHPFAALAASLFILYSGIDLFLPGPVGIALLATALARIAFDALGARAPRTLDFGNGAFRIGLTVLLGMALTSGLVMTRFDNALRDVQSIGIGLGMYVGISALVDRPRRIAQIVAIAGVATATSSLPAIRAAIATGGLTVVLGLASDLRFGSLGSDPNGLAASANAILPAVLGLGVRLRGWRRWALVPLVVLLVADVLLSQSRAGVLVLVLVGLVLLGRWALRRPWLSLTVLVLLGSTLVALPQRYWVRFVSIGQFGGIVVDRSLQLRAHLLEGGLQTFLDHPWLGVGLGNFSNNAPRFILGSWVAHNAYLEVAVTLGILGLVAFLVVLGAAAAMLRRAAKLWRLAGRRRDLALVDGLLLGFAAFCVMGMTLSLQYHALLFIVFGLANAARRCAESGAD